MMFPLLYTISTSLKPHTAVLEYPPSLIPLHVTFRNFVDAWSSNNFGLYFWNSLQVAVVTTLLTMLITSGQAYAFARMHFWGKNVLFALYLLTMMVPSLVLIIPQFILAKNLHLLNSLAGLVVVYVSGNIPFQTFLLRGFFESIPKELEEAAILDGAGHFTIFARIVMPLSTSALAVVGIFSFLGSWDEFTWALTAIHDPSKWTLPIAIQLFHGQHGTQWGLVFAASLIAIAPVLTVFLIFQRYFIKGIMTGGVRG